MPERKNTKKTNIMGDMPHNLEAEQALLACLLLDPEVQNEIISGLSDEDFYTEAHKNVFDGMSTLLKRNQPIDLVTLSDIMEKNGVLDASGGIDYIASLVDIMPSSANFRKYFDIVKRESLLRRLIKGSASVIDECRQSTDGDSSLAFAEKTVFDISQNVETTSMKKTTWKSVLLYIVRILELVLTGAAGGALGAAGLGHSRLRTHGGGTAGAGVILGRTGGAGLGAATAGQQTGAE